MSSFRKRHVQKPVPGTRTSPQTGQIITSSGNPSFDVIFGGGLPVGSICLIEEDKYVTFSKVLAKYFIAEGVVSGQSVLLGSLDDDPQELMRKLPKPLNDDEVEIEKSTEQENGEFSQNGLRIAWRYNDLPPVNSEQIPSKIGHHFNLMEHMDKNLLDFVDTLLWNGNSYVNSDEVDDDYDCGLGDEDNVFSAIESNTESKDDTDQNTTSSSSGSNISCKEVDLEQERINAAAALLSGNSNETLRIQNATKLQVDAVQPPIILGQKQNNNCEKIFNNSKYQRFLKLVQSFAKEEKFSSSTLVYRSLCRICITSLGSPLWYDEEFPKNILKFLTVLRGIVRNSVSVCFITMPMHLISKYDESLVPKIRNLVDYAIELESFSGSEHETNNAFKEYNGLIHLHKITAVNTLTAYMPETSDLAFKLRRKKFVIEKLHLPPEMQEDIKENMQTFSCSGGSSASATSMDF
ncbi:elongator complex protein 4 [Bactrocera dorsalis]|uniref:Elongator complex protein 4 n=1 Tax=Bactrocera dorsalis TaxID=27457 RepID=A0A6I9VAK7_BACDO|nr:elongator complex protein 4 [Bactrocera dorsalis]XP_011206208.2 elongator complex protein 4 [Bactrocera dorsalis]